MVTIKIKMLQNSVDTKTVKTKITFFNFLMKQMCQELRVFLCIITMFSFIDKHKQSNNYQQNFKFP